MSQKTSNNVFDEITETKLPNRGVEGNLLVIVVLKETNMETEIHLVILNLYRNNCFLLIGVRHIVQEL